MIDPKAGKNTQFTSDRQPEHNGRPKGVKNFSTRVKELLSGISEDKDWTSPLAAEKIKIIFSRDKDEEYIYPVAERQKAIDSVLDRIEGKPLQTNINKNINEIAELTKEEINELHKGFEDDQSQDDK